MRHSFLNQKNAKNSRGFSLVEVIVVIALMGIIGLTVGGVLQFIFKSLETDNILVTRNNLLLSLRKSAGDLSSLRESLNKNENKAFFSCVCGSSGGTTCTSGTPLPFSLYELGDQKPKKHLQYYDSSGLPCADSSPRCILEIETHFIAQCMPTLPSADPVPPSTCTTPAEFVGVIFTVRQNPNAIVSGPALKPLQGAAYTQVAQLAPTGGGWCP